MPKWIFVCLFTLLAVEACAQGRRGRKSEPVDLQHFTYELVKFDADNVSDGDGEFGLYLPKGYDPEGEKVYPWILWLHGMNENASRFHDGGGAKALDSMRGEGKIPELIFVVLLVPRRTIYANGEALGDVEDYVLKDVISHVRGKCRISDARNESAIMGVSMGGMGAMRIALKDPKRFGSVAVHSAAAFPPDPTALEGRAAKRVQQSIQWLGLGDLLGDPIDPEKWAKYIPAAIASKMEPADLHELRIFFDAGTEDRYGFAPPNEEFHTLLDDRELTHTFRLVEGGGHSWGSGSMLERLAESLRFVAVPMTPKADSEESRPTDAEESRDQAVEGDAVKAEAGKANGGS